MSKHSKKKMDKKDIILNLLRFIFIITLIISAIYIVKWVKDERENKKIEEKVFEAVIVEENITGNEEVIEPEYNIDFAKLKETNNDIVAWLKVNGTNVEYPVVQANDNNYYLKRNLDKKFNFAGWIFMDYKNKLDGTDKNIVVYGHNRKDGSMFGSLKNILTEEWYNNEENYIIDFITENEKQKYKVFSVYKIAKEDYYIDTYFKGNEFEKFVQTLRKRSVKDFGIQPTADDTILTLSTCANNNQYRVVLHAVFLDGDVK